MSTSCLQREHFLCAHRVHETHSAFKHFDSSASQRLQKNHTQPEHMQRVGHMTFIQHHRRFLGPTGKVPFRAGRRGGCEGRHAEGPPGARRAGGLAENWLSVFLHHVVSLGLTAWLSLSRSGFCTAVCEHSTAGQRRIFWDTRRGRDMFVQRRWVILHLVSAPAGGGRGFSRSRAEPSGSR